MFLSFEVYVDYKLSHTHGLSISLSPSSLNHMFIIIHRLYVVSTRYPAIVCALTVIHLSVRCPSVDCASAHRRQFALVSQLSVACSVSVIRQHHPTIVPLPLNHQLSRMVCPSIIYRLSVVSLHVASSRIRPSVCQSSIRSLSVCRLCVISPPRRQSASDSQCSVFCLSAVYSYFFSLPSVSIIAP